MWFEVRSRIAPKRQTKPINQVLIAIAPGMRIVAMGRKTSVVNAEKKLGIAALGRLVPPPNLFELHARSEMTEVISSTMGPNEEQSR